MTLRSIVSKPWAVEPGDRVVFPHRAAAAVMDRVARLCRRMSCGLTVAHRALPAGAVRRVFEHDAARAISSRRRSEVAKSRRCAGGVAGRIRPRSRPLRLVGRRRRARPSASSTPRTRVDAPSAARTRSLSPAPSAPLLDRDVDLSDEAEESGERLRRRSDRRRARRRTRLPGARRLWQIAHPALRLRAVVETEAHVVDPAQRGRRGVERLEGEVQLLPVVDRQEQVTNRTRRLGRGRSARRGVYWLPSDFDIFCPSTIRCSAWSQ